LKECCLQHRVLLLHTLAGVISIKMQAAAFVEQYVTGNKWIYDCFVIV
jgi:hypothetical protein